ncbi:MAG: T9SS type A sorting domain-containing protein [Bacteroidetes bacterium]|nr:T9SS type A sorting domain-containing protein [Bacteroidota bacterium]
MFLDIHPFRTKILLISLLVIGSGLITQGTAQIITGIKSTSFIGTDVGDWFAEPSPYDYLQPAAENKITFYGMERLFWYLIEPTKTSGYDWVLYDSIIQKIDAVNGDISPTIRSLSTWATEPPAYINPGKKPSSIPKPEYRQRYYDFIKAFMERYDNDGIDDMPGLKYAHNYLQIEDEAENLGDSWSPSSACSNYTGDAHYRCAAQEYGETLKLAYQAAKEANPNAKIISFSFNPGDYFDNNPSGNLPSNPKTTFLNEVFANYSGYFDIIGIQYNYDYTGLPAWFNYLKTEWGHLNKPIQCADAGAMPMLVRCLFNCKDDYINKYPYMTDSEILTVLDEGPSNPKYSRIKLWWEGEKAKISVKKAIVTASAGIDNIFFQFYMQYGGTQNPWNHSGLLSLGSKYGGSNSEPIGTARPVVYALGQLNEKVVDFKTIENLNPIPLREDPYNWVWQYKINDDTYIVWTEKTGETTIDLSSYLSTANAKITHIVTELDSNYNPIYPPEETVPTNSITLDEAPVFVESSTITSVEDEGENVPKEFLLYQNYPNPFNPETSISYTIPNVETRRGESLQHVKLRVYDVLGREAATLIDEEKAAGKYEIKFDASKLPSGIYFYTLKAGDYLQARKMLLIK